MNCNRSIELIFSYECEWKISYAEPLDPIKTTKKRKIVVLVYELVNRSDLNQTLHAISNIISFKDRLLWFEADFVKRLYFWH